MPEKVPVFSPTPPSCSKRPAPISLAGHRAGLLQRLQKEGVTIFLSSHQLEEIETYCDRAVILKDGVVVEDIDMTKARAQHRQSVSYTLADGTQESFDYTGDVNDLVARLAKLDLSRLEIRGRTVSEEFLKYYEGDET